MTERSWKNRESLNKNEIAKLQKDGLEILNELDSLAHKPYGDISWDDIERLKWAGIYAQRPKDGHFLIRVKLASGKMTAEQADTIAEISKRFGKSSIQITIRQCIQIHNIVLRDVPTIFEMLQKANLTTVEGCGDVPRNILGNPLMGIDPEELFDTEPIVKDLVKELVGNPEYSNLPRKYKISVSANPHDNGFAGINDIAFVPAKISRQDYRADGFHVYVGGGLSDSPRLARKLSFFIEPSRVLDVTTAVAKIFREYGYRENRKHCRLKFLVDDMGIKEFERVVETYTGKLPKGGREVQRKWGYGRFHGIHRQKQEDLYYCGFNVIGGEMTADDLFELSHIAKHYGNGELRTTNSQCIIIPNIKGDLLNSLKYDAIMGRFEIQPGNFTGYSASCTGNRYCNFAPIETKDRLSSITTELEKRFPQITTPFRVNLTGCVHSCAHPQIADIGLVGGRVKYNGSPCDAFSLWVGGSLGKNSRFGYKLNGKINEYQIVDALSAIIEFYLSAKNDKESFTDFVHRHSEEDFQSIVNSYLV